MSPHLLVSVIQSYTCMCGKDICIMMCTTVLFVMAKSNHIWEDYQKENIYNLCLSWVRPENTAWGNGLPADLFVELIPINGIRNMEMIKKKKRRQIISFGGGKTKPILCFHLSSKLVHFLMERHFIFVLHQSYYFFFLIYWSIVALACC